MNEELAKNLAAAANAPAVGDQVQRRRAGNAVRVIIDRLIASDPPDAELAVIAATLEAVGAGMADWPPAGSAVADTHGQPVPKRHFDGSPLLGLANPIAPPLRVSEEDGVMVVRANFGAAYEGPPGCVHGGFIAAAFDEALGLIQAASGNHGMTGTLSVKYRKPTPLYTELRIVGETDRIEGRRTHVRGRCYAGDVLTAEAEGVFIRVDFLKIAELYERKAPGPG